MNKTLYEKLIQDILDKGYAVCDNFIPKDDADKLRNDLMKRFDTDEFKEANSRQISLL